MPFSLPLPAGLRQARWKVKIRDKETREPPHATIIRGTQAWRMDLRTARFMDSHPDSAEVPEELIALIQNQHNWNLLCEAWDRTYPMNPVAGEERDDSTEDE